MEYTDFMAEFVLNVKRMQAGLKPDSNFKNLMKASVNCQFCKNTVPAMQAVKQDGSLICPDCGRPWMKLIR